MSKNTIITLIMALTSTTQVWAQLERFPYVVVINEDNDTVVSDDVFYQKARGIQFAVGKSDIPEDSPFCRELVRDVLPKIDPVRYHLDHIMLRGSASPEGPYELNARLGRNRRQAIFDFINKHGNFIIESNTTSNKEVAEDYPGLLRLMKDANDPDYNTIAELVDKYMNDDPATLKSKMKSIQGGALWKRLLNTYFPELRTAKVMLFFSLNKGRIRIPKFPKVNYYPSVDMSTLSAPSLKDFVPYVEPAKDEPRRELLSVKTNLLFDFAYVPGYDRFCPIPNVAIEYYPMHGHFTYGASLDFPWWQHYWQHKYFQIRNYQLEGRYYFRSGDVRERGYGNGQAFTGWYVKAYAHAGLFSLCFDENRGWEGEGIGGGLGFGKVIPLGKKSRWRLELGMQVGYFRCKYDPYQYECPVTPEEQDHLYYYKWKGEASLFQKRQYRWSWIGPTRAEVTLTYDLLFRKRHKSGFSFNSIEKGGQR